MERYRIVHRQWFDEKASPTKEVWLVEEWRRGLFGYRWKALSQSNWDAYEPYNTQTEFSSLEDAKACIERMRAGAARLEYVHTVVQ